MASSAASRSGPFLLWADHLILKRHAFRIILLEPGLGGILVGKDLDVVFVANLLARIDINPDNIGQENVSITRSIAGCSRFLTLTQCGERPAR